MVTAANDAQALWPTALEHHTRIELQALSLAA
jgi:hypothetical protein